MLSNEKTVTRAVMKPMKQSLIDNNNQ